jgi:uncharacterized membrane protein HdeD (DUF308 family)
MVSAVTKMVVFSFGVTLLISAVAYIVYMYNARKNDDFF